MLFGVIVFGVWIWLCDEWCCWSGFVVLLCSVSVFKVVVVLVVGIVVVWICNIDRGVFILICGLLWVLFVVFGVFVFCMVLFGWMCFGCYVYVIGGGVEVVCCVGVNFYWICMFVFGFVFVMVGVGGIVYVFWLWLVLMFYDGGMLVFYVVVAVVIGGISFFGGCGKLLYVIFGGLVIVVIDNGMGL